LYKWVDRAHNFFPAFFVHTVYLQCFISAPHVFGVPDVSDVLDVFEVSDVFDVSDCV